MRNLLLSLFILTASFTGRATDLTSFFSKADDFLNRYVKNGRVAYRSVGSDRVAIQSLYEDIKTMNLSDADDKEKKAFYLNAYNLIVIYQVSEYYPLKSPLDKSGFFDKVKHVVAGESMTLNFLEIKKLLHTYNDPRIHFALACAAVSCPPLNSLAFHPDNTEDKLTTLTKRSINNPDWLMVNHAAKKVGISKIFDWYKQDFGSDESGVLRFINKYRKDKIPSDYNISYYEYNWSLNEDR